MTQTVLSRVADFLESLLAWVSQRHTMPFAEAGDLRQGDERAEAEPHFGREEAYYWAMHSHW